MNAILPRNCCITHKCNLTQKYSNPNKCNIIHEYNIINKCNITKECRITNKCQFVPGFAPDQVTTVLIKNDLIPYIICDAILEFFK